VRVLARLGVRTALVTEAVGILDPTWNVGDVMMVTDHLNLTTHEGLGTISDAGFEMFPNMRSAYDRALTDELREVVRTEKLLSARVGTSTVDLVEGVLASLQDPSYETPAQMRMLRSMGAHAVATSMAVEIIALRQLKVRTAALAHLAYRAADGEEHTLEDEVTARSDYSHMQRFLRGWIVRAHRLGD
jgi:purine-nucleoside phosphorylase